MRQLIKVACVSIILFAASSASAALIPQSEETGTAACNRPVTSPSRVYNIQGKTITYYVPHNSPGCERSIEGCVATSCRGLDAQKSRLPTCLDAVRLGKAKYVTLASDSSQYGKYFHLGTITYRSALDMQMYTVKDVVGYVHDTGRAFRGRPDKLDVCTTVCSTCTDAQAGALAQGRNVSLNRSQQGDLDTNNAPFPPTTQYGNPSNPYSPVSVSPFSAYGATPSQFGQPNAAAPMAGVPASPTSPLGMTGSPSTGDGQETTTVTGSRSAATIFVQPSNVKAGSTILISWTSVNMKPSSCKTKKNDAEFATGNEATKRDVVESGTATYTLECTTASGDIVKASSSVVIQ